MKRKLLIFHPALAPYRVDFFNALGVEYDCLVCFMTRNNANQNFDQESLLRNATFKYTYLDQHIVLFRRNINRGYWAKIHSFDPDIIICSEYGISLIATLAYRLFHRKQFRLYTSCDDSLAMLQQHNKLHTIIRDLVIKKLDGLITISKDVSEWYGQNTSVRRVCDFPIIRNEQLFLDQQSDLLLIAKRYIEHYKLSEARIILFVGRFVAVKNLKALLVAFSKVQDQTCKLVLIGDGSERELLNELSLKLKIQDRVIFPGRYEGQSLLAWYYVANLFILPSLYEPFGAVINEALLAGCKIMISKYAGSIVLVNAENGVIFDPLNAEEFVSMLQMVVSRLPITDSDPLPRNSLMPIKFQDKIQQLIAFLNA